MPEARYKHTCTFAGDQLLVMGGLNGNKRFGTVNAF